MVELKTDCPELLALLRTILAGKVHFLMALNGSIFSVFRAETVCILTLSSKPQCSGFVSGWAKNFVLCGSVVFVEDTLDTVLDPVFESTPHLNILCSFMK